MSPLNARSAQPEPGQDNRAKWRVSEDDLQDYLDAAYKATAERIASGAIETPAAADED